jgi:hypothetical protein
MSLNAGQNKHRTKGEKMTQINETTLPELIGSEKQIAWAEKIRARELPALQAAVDAAQKMFDSASETTKPRWERLLKNAQDVLNELITATSASWIINNY